MKKAVITILSAALICLAAAGCGASAPAEPEAPSLSETEASPALEVEAAPEASEEPSEAEEPAETEEPEESGSEPVSAERTPIYGSQVADGTYPIEVSSSSSMFRIVDAELTVAEGEMTAVLTLSGTGYEKLYMGVGEEALADTDDNCIYFEEDGEGQYTYTVPVEALDQDTDVAAWSIRKEQWYDRVLVFQSALIPGDAITAE